MGLRFTKGDDAKWGGPPGPRGSPWSARVPLVRAGPPGPALRGFIDFSSTPTRASAADQGVRPT
jgi:hypothetical protein